jgi:epoxyqueuosine reductase QueG
MFAAPAGTCAFGDVMELSSHPTVRRVREHGERASRAIDAAELRALCLEAGAADVGLVGIDRPEVADQRAEVLAALPGARTLIAYVIRMNPSSIRAPARSLANLEFHHTVDESDEVGRRIVRALIDRGYRAVNPATGFPMELERPGGRSWVVSHKPIAVAAGLGKMGLHRNVIHPRFGNFILLGTVITDLAASEEGAPIAYEPCLDCKLCVAACPVGAIGADGHFDFTGCYTHNYHEFMGGFAEWEEQLATATSARDFRTRVSEGESASMWQSLSFGANYKAAYCLAVCPAGEEVIQPFLKSRQHFTAEVVRPLQDKVESLYVVPGSDAEAHACKRYPHKQLRHVRGRLRAGSIEGLIRGMPLAFQRGRADGLAARYHFSFRGDEEADVSIDIRDQVIRVERGLVGDPDVRVTADATTWLGLVRGERSMLWAVMTGRLRVRGSIRLLRRFGQCFPS